MSFEYDKTGNKREIENYASFAERALKKKGYATEYKLIIEEINDNGQTIYGLKVEEKENRNEKNIQYNLDN